jgi:hypothetical protein
VVEAVFRGSLSFISVRVGGTARSSQGRAGFARTFDGEDRSAKCRVKEREPNRPLSSFDRGAGTGPCECGRRDGRLRVCA